MDQEVPHAPHAASHPALIATGTHLAPTVRNASVVLACDRADTHRPVRPDAEVATMLETSIRTVARTRAAWCATGRASLDRKVRQTPPTPRKIDDAAMLHLAELQLEHPPDDQASWTLKLLRDRAVALEIIEPGAIETVRQALRKGGPPSVHDPALPDPCRGQRRLRGGDGTGAGGVCRRDGRGAGGDLSR